MRRFVSFGVVCLIALSLTSCSEGFNVSDDTKQQGMKVVCSMSEMTVSQIEAGGALAKVAAGLIADNSNDPKIVDIATKVRNGNTDEKLLDQLSSYVEKECNV